MSESQTSPASRTAAMAWRGCAMLCALLVAGFYHWTLRSAGGDLRPGPDKGDYYNLLVDGFQDGHLYMKTGVDPALLALPPEQRPGNAPYLLDASLYNDRYYLYFGVVPAVLLHWPFAAITGWDMPDAMAVLVLAAGALAFGFMWCRDLRRHLWPSLGPRMDWLVILALGLGTGLPAVLRRPLFYEEATLAGWLFGALMLWALLRARIARGRGTGWLILAGIACGLAVGSRANLVLAGVGTLAIGAWFVGRRVSTDFKRGTLPALTAAGAGALVVGIGLATYNYARFGSIIEFGHSYQLGHNPEQMFRLTNLGHNLGLYYGQPPELNAYFPYVFPPDEGIKPVDYIGRESVHGQWLWFAAAVIVAPAMFFAGRRNLIWIVPMTLWFGGNLLVTGLLGVRANRYMLDFHPALVGLVLFGAGWLTANRPRRLWLLSLVGVILLATVFNVLASFQVHGFFSRSDPVGYERLGCVADRVVWRVAPWIFKQAGDWEAGLRWPPAGEGGVLPLLTVGVPEFQNRLWVRLDGHGRGAFEFYHRDYGSVRGNEFAYKPGAEVRFRMSGAFLLPPVWHDWYGDLSRDERAAFRRRLRLWVDGAMVLDRDVPSFSTAPWLHAWNALQHGEINVRRPDLSQAKKLGDRRGAIRMRLRLPSDRFGSNEPLLQTGSVTAWDVVMIQFSRPGYVRLMHDSSGQGAVASEEFPVDYDALHTVQIESPVAHDNLTWNRYDTLESRNIKHITVRWNDRVVLESSLPPHAATPASMAMGLNDFASACRASFAGEMRAASFLEPLAEPAALDWRQQLDPGEAFVGMQGVLVHWQRRDYRQAAVVWRRENGEDAIRLGWLDNGQVEWAAVLPDTEPGEFLFERNPGPEADGYSAFRFTWAGRELFSGHTDFFAEEPVATRALDGTNWTTLSRRIAGSVPERTEAPERNLPGRIKMHLALPPEGLRQSAPLLSAGRAGRADLLFLRPTGPDTYVLGLDHWGVAAFESQPVTIPAAQKFELVVEMGSLFADGEYPRDRMRVMLDCKTVLDVQTPLHPVQGDEIQFGWNEIGFSTSSERFPGQIFSTRKRVPLPP